MLTTYYKIQNIKLFKLHSNYELVVDGLWSEEIPNFEFERIINCTSVVSLQHWILKGVGGLIWIFDEYISCINIYIYKHNIYLFVMLNWSFTLVTNKSLSFKFFYSLFIYFFVNLTPYITLFVYSLAYSNIFVDSLPVFL